MTQETEQIQISALQDFLIRYKQRSEELVDARIAESKFGFGKLLKGYSTKREAVREELKSIADEYNIFDVLGVKTKEAITHSPFLANLLDPIGSHAQRDLFYNRFIETVYSDSIVRKLKDIERDNLQVFTEYYTTDGFIDIFIHHRSISNPFCIVIENKIYAGDQYKQLRRYYDYARDVLKFNKENIFLIYLKDGSAAGQDSMNTEMQQAFMETENLVNISYSEDISRFLFRCLEEIKAPTVKAVVDQYLKTIKTLGL